MVVVLFCMFADLRFCFTFLRRFPPRNDDR
jgi:hypothetical protein